MASAKRAVGKEAARSTALAPISRKRVPSRKSAADTRAVRDAGLPEQTEQIREGLGKIGELAEAIREMRTEMQELIRKIDFLLAPNSPGDDKPVSQTPGTAENGAAAETPTATSVAEELNDPVAPDTVSVHRSPELSAEGGSEA